MCIIFSKPAGVAFPSITTLKACWERNPHGAGFAVATGKHVYIRKGFMTWDEFAAIDFDGLEDHACVFHFRYATHGSMSPGNCHPFPIVGNLKRTDATVDVAVAHNGVILGQQTSKNDYSDTMCYIENSIAPYYKQCKGKGKMYTSVKRRANLLAETGSKWSFLYSDGTIVNVGDGIECDGVWYSNSGFRTYTAPKPVVMHYPEEIGRPLPMAGYF